MLCANCSKRLQPDWRFCPECAHEIVISSDEYLNSPGVKYFPEAFNADTYRLGKTIGETTGFYQVFLRYVLSVVADITKLVHFRAQIIHEANLIGGDKHKLSKDHVLWCALSVASDKYFSEKALLYDWTAADEQQIVSGWYDLIGPAFIPNSPNKKMEAKMIRDWIAQFLALHKRASGPLPACDACTSKCNYQYEVSLVTQDSKTKSDFQNSINRGDASGADSAGIFCRLLTMRLTGKKDIDLDYCLAIHLIKGLEVPVTATTALSTDAQLVLAHNVRNSLKAQDAEQDMLVEEGAITGVREQVFQTIVSQALAGSPYRQICAGPMQIHNITAEEVEAEVHRRKSLSK